MRQVGAASFRLPLLSAALAALCGTVVLVPHRSPELDALIGMPWYALAALFAVTQACPIPVRIDGQPRKLSFVAFPLALGLLLGDPTAVTVGAAVGSGAVLFGVRRVRLARGAWDTALAAATASVGAVVFAWLRPTEPGPLSGPDHPLAAALAAVAAVVVAVVVISTANLFALGWSGERRGARTGLGDLVVGAANAIPTAVLAVLGVFSFTHAEGALPMAATGAAALLGQRAFATLGRRQDALERLYRLSDALVDAPGVGDVVRSVVVQSLELMDAGYAEVLLERADGARLAWTARAGGDVLGPFDGRPLAEGLAFPPAEAGLLPDGSVAERTALRVRSVDGAVIAPLRVGPDLAGHLMVAGRPGEGGGFTSVDVRVLLTVANHANVALSNAVLIERLHVEARQDELTGLPNRTHFRELLERSCAGETGFAVMLLDFDGFKAVNDTLGHPAGDELLRVLSRRLADVARQDATVARLGGDEFAVLAPGRGDEPSANALAERLLSVFDAPVEVAGTRLRLGGSLGIALSPRHATGAADLMRDADVAMYAAKAGSGGPRVFREDMLEGGALTLSLGSDLKDAVARDEVEVALHPVVVLGSGTLHSVEVLARWTHPGLGEVPPEQLFRAAEQAGLTAALSARILDRALRLCREWLDDGQVVRVAVNMAARWLADTGLPEQVGLALARHGVPADLLCLELTERSVIADPRRATSTLERLRGMGVHLAVDDFGTGYSSLTYLSRLPVDQLKIDQAFVARVQDSPRDLAIVRAIVDLGHHLGLEVVAEGVTDAAVRQTLAEAGCRLAQGYLFARPFEPGLLPGFIADGTARRPASAVSAPPRQRVGRPRH
jgi:diguanylate cyclase (GGDEF)-like protein